MTIEVWVVVMPNGDRPYTRSSPPGKELADKWKSEGARIFRMTGQVTDDPNVWVERVEPLFGYPLPATITEL